MMDGVTFSSKHIDPSLPLKIAGLHAAGDPPPRPLETGEAWEIMTGAAVPDDCDTIVPYEDLSEPFVLTKPYVPRTFIHDFGHDAAAGDVLVSSRKKIGPAEIAIAASVGKTQLAVFRQPRIALITTGDEAVPPDTSPQPWQIRRSNGPMLEAALHRMALPPCYIAHVSDDPSITSTIIREALSQCDLLILCGGISMGKKDHVRAAIEQQLGAPEFHGVELRPGKPLAFWKGKPHIFALPGNPVSVLATFTRFVIPAIQHIQGLSQICPLRLPVSDIKPLPSFTWLLPVSTDESGHLIPRPPRNSGDFTSIAQSIGMVEIPPEPDFTPNQPLAFHPFP